MSTTDLTLLQASRDALSAMCGIRSLSEVELAKTLDQIWFKGFVHGTEVHQEKHTSAAGQVQKETIDRNAFVNGAYAMFSHVIRVARPYGFRFVSAHSADDREAALAKFLDEFARFHSLGPRNHQDAICHCESIPNAHDPLDVGLGNR